MLKKIFLISIGILIPFSIVFALEIDWPPSPMGTDLIDGSGLTELTQYLYEWGIALGGLAAFIALLIAGFMYLTSVGDPQKMADARGRIVWALAGLVLLLASWLILNTINPDLTRLDLGKLLPGCETNGNCPVNYFCTGDKTPGDGKKEGNCVPIAGWTGVGPKKPACSYAIGFSSTSFGGNEKTPPIEVNNKGWLSNDRFGIYSVKSFFDDSDYDKKCWNASSSPVACAVVVDANGNRLCDWNASKDPECFRDCGQDACGCRLRLYDVYLTCGDELQNNVPAYSTNLSGYREKGSWLGDGQVDCIRLDPPIWAE